MSWVLTPWQHGHDSHTLWYRFRGQVTSAAMDRLLHHAHVVVMEGNSFRNPPGGRKVA